MYGYSTKKITFIYGKFACTNVYQVSMSVYVCICNTHVQMQCIYGKYVCLDDMNVWIFHKEIAVKLCAS